MRQPRVLRTRLDELLTVEERSNIALTAASIGIAPNTLRKFLADRWDQISRDSIEKICDRWNVNPQEVFELVPSTFWSSLLSDRHCYQLVAPPDSGDLTRAQPRDAGARSIIGKYLSEFFPEVNCQNAFELISEPDILEYVKNFNCIVVGSPRSNLATEVVISRHFNAIPFKTDETNRQKVPFRFVFGEGRHIPSAICESNRPDLGTSSKVGICDRSASEMIVEGDWWSPEEYMPRVLRRARDCALILVIKRPLGTRRDVQTVVVAGMSGVGTEGAATALIRDFRALEPTERSGHALGILEVTYNKPIPYVDKRTLTGYTWKHVEGTGTRGRPQTRSRKGRKS